MIALDEDALVCDLAETYHIYDYRSLPCKKVAIFSCGLREDSRIKMKMTGAKITIDQTMLAVIVDRLGLLAWMNSKDGTKGINRPKSLLEEISGGMESNPKTVVGFSTSNDFNDEWNRRKEG